jgi:hypothetical protein
MSACREGQARAIEQSGADVDQIGTARKYSTLLF